MSDIQTMSFLLPFAYHLLVARLTGLEPATFGLEDRCTSSCAKGVCFARQGQESNLLRRTFPGYPLSRTVVEGQIRLGILVCFWCPRWDLNPQILSP